ncbi:conserved hypothetical protein [Trichinella spiralis]|uniref:hypothetical protein n=1 Tax=Trichinella spiralis TaxID=6334 RepID=UPI0001EFB94E|nr:conserved hypothetical protein [Trichinella spiralis]
MWQFDYAFRLHHRMGDLCKSVLVQVDVQNCGVMFYGVAYHKGCKHDLEIVLIEDSEKRSVSRVSKEDDVRRHRRCSGDVGPEERCHPEKDRRHLGLRDLPDTGTKRRPVGTTETDSPGGVLRQKKRNSISARASGGKCLERRFTSPVGTPSQRGELQCQPCPGPPLTIQQVNLYGHIS